MNDTLRRIDCWDTIKIRSIICLVVWTRLKAVDVVAAAVGGVVVVAGLGAEAVISLLIVVRRRLKAFLHSQSKNVR
jgi:hypothetical protein